MKNKTEIMKSVNGVASKAVMKLKKDVYKRQAVLRVRPICTPITLCGWRRK